MRRLRRPSEHGREAAARDALLALGVAVVVFALQLPLRLRVVNLMDEGAVLELAREIVAGRLPFKDVIQPALPAVHYATAAVFALFGVSFDAARTFGAALFAVTAAVMFLMARWRLGWRGALGFVVLYLCYRVWAYPHWHMLNYSSFAVALVLVATWLCGRAFARGTRTAYAVTGAVAALAVFSKQDSGALGVVAIGVAILAAPVHAGARSRLRAAVAYGVGGLAVLAAAAAYAAAVGIMPDVIDHAILSPLYGLQHFEYQSRPPLWGPLVQDVNVRRQTYGYLPTILLDLHWPAIAQSRIYRDTALPDLALRIVYHLPWLVLVAAAPLLLWRRPSALGVARDRLVLAVAAAFVVAFNRPHDWIHLMVLYPPTLLLGAYLVAAVVGRLGRLRVVAEGAVWLALLAAFGVSTALAVELRRAYDTPIATPNGIIYGTAPQARSLQSLIDALATAAPSGAPLSSFPYHPTVNFASDRPFLTRFLSIWPAEGYPDRDREIFAALDARPDGLVVYNLHQVPHFQRMTEYAPALSAWLADHYAIDRMLGGDLGGYGFLLLRRRSEPITGSLLGDGLAGARVVIEPANGPARDATPLERAALVATTVWPFERVLRTATLPDATTAVRFRVVPTPGMHFRTAYGTNPEHWLNAPPTRPTFAVTIEAEDGAPTEVARASIDPFLVPGDRRWADVDVDLTPWAGRPIEVVLRVTGGGGDPMRAGWASPRLEGPRS